MEAIDKKRKRCNVCKKIKPIERYGVVKTSFKSKAYHRNRCKDCDSKNQMSKYYSDEKERERKYNYNKEYSKKNKDKINKRRKKWTKKNRFKINAQKRRWYHDNSTKVKKGRNIFYHENKIRISERKKELYRLPHNHEKIKIKWQNDIKNLNDNYVISQMSRNKSISPDDLREHPILIEIYRLQLKIKRTIKEQTT